MTVNASDYDWWLRALAGEEIGGPTLPVHESDPQAGFWRKRVSRAGAFVPVAIWRGDDDKYVALVDGKEGNAYDQWTFVCRYPVTEEQYNTRVETGRWHDEDGAVAKSLDAPSIGHNNAPQDEAEILKGQIEAASANLSEYAEIKDDEAASRAQSVRSRLLELSREADKKREELKKPHLEASKAVDAKWQPLVKEAKGAADAIRDALGAHETRKANAAEAARRAAEEEYRRKAAEAARNDAPLPPVPETLKQPASDTKVRGAYGRAAAVKAVKVATVEDQDLAYGYLKTHPELRDLIARLAQRAVDAGHTVPGVKVEEVRKVA